jgi:hypothetical protein
MTASHVRDHLLTIRFAMWQTLGALGLLGLLVLGAAIAVWSMVPGLMAETKALHAQTWQARKVAGIRAAQAAQEKADISAPDKFPELFSTFAVSGQDLSVIFAQAREINLTLGSAQYQFAVEPGARFARYQVTLPVKDQYGTIRRFIASVLNSVPNAALQEIHVERPAVDGNQIEARIRFALIYRTERP